MSPLSSPEAQKEPSQVETEEALANRPKSLLPDAVHINVPFTQCTAAQELNLYKTEKLARSVYSAQHTWWKE